MANTPLIKMGAYDQIPAEEVEDLVAKISACAEATADPVAVKKIAAAAPRPVGVGEDV
jgi:hypothetical protein